MFYSSCVMPLDFYCNRSLPWSTVPFPVSRDQVVPVRSGEVGARVGRTVHRMYLDAGGFANVLAELRGLAK